MQPGGRELRVVTVADGVPGQLNESPHSKTARVPSSTAAHYGLSSLFAIVDWNGLQQGARTEETKTLEPLADKWVSFGWEVREVDGHDHAELLDTFRRPGATRPVCGVSRSAPAAVLHDCRKIFVETLISLAREDERIVAVCNDSVGSSNLAEFKAEFPERMVNVGIAEQDMVGVGAGLANGGMIPSRPPETRRSFSGISA